MGQKLFDQYSLLHFASGVIAYFFGLRLWMWIALHVAFELIENTRGGMKFINQYLPFWPGGKPRADSAINSFGDTIAAIVGWLAAANLDGLGKQRQWYVY